MRLPRFEQLEDRRVLFSPAGTLWDAGPGATVSYSYMADGVQDSNNLDDFTAASTGWTNTSIATMITNGNMPAGAIGEIDRAFTAWSRVSDINFNLVTDDGAAYGSSTVDIRIGAHPIDGNMGANFGAHSGFPPPSTEIPDVHFDTANTFLFNAGPFNLFNFAAHELGHSIGLFHVTSGTGAPLMNPTVPQGNTGPNLFGPQLDDVRGAQILYGPEIVAGVLSVSAADNVAPGNQAADGTADIYRIVRRTETLIDPSGDPDVNDRNVDVLDVFIGDASNVNALHFAFSVDFASLTGLTFTGSADGDRLIVDYSGGNPIPAGGVTFNGAGSTADRVTVQNGSWITTTYVYGGADSGSIGLDGSTITYSGTEVLINSGTTTNAVFNLPATQNPAVQLRDDGFGPDPDGNTPGSSALTSTTSAFTQFVNPTTSLTVNLGDAGDTLTVIALDAAFNANVQLNGGTAGDQIIVHTTTGTTNTWTVDGDGGSDNLQIFYAATSTYTAGQGTVTSTQGLRPVGFDTIEVLQLLGEYGDAPASYGTLFNNVVGARHVPGSALRLGAASDLEIDGLPTATALGDDNNNLDDEDGVTLPGTIIARLGAQITVNASAAGRLDAWIDYNRNGVFDASEKIFNNVLLAAGNNTLDIIVPANIVVGASYARFRFSTAGNLGPIGDALDGEMEDYAINLFAPPPGSITLLPDPANPGQGLLLVNGRSMSDAIVVRPMALNPTRIEAIISPFVVQANFELATVDRIAIFGLQGSDSIVVDSRLTIPATIFGDEDNDSIVSGSGNDYVDGGPGIDSIATGLGNDIVLGGLGDDSLAAEGGLDLVIGGSGRDMLQGGTQDDIVIGGNLLANELALRAILATWTNGQPFATRIALLAPQINAATVVDDGLADFVWGNTGRDWLLDFALRDFFFDFDPNPVTGDRRN